MAMERCVAFGAVGLLVLLGPGCGPSGPKTYPVSGTVTFNGEKIPKGHIVFVPVDESIAPDAGEIVDGRFDFRAKAGKKEVRISADREVGEMDPVMHTIPRQSYIPSKYNVESVLEREVVPDGDNTFTFELEE